MLVRFGAASCVAAAIFAFSSSSTSIVKSDGIAHGATISRSMLLRAAKERAATERSAAERAEKETHAAVRLAALTSSTSGTAPRAGLGAVIARALGAGATVTGIASTYNPFRAADASAGGKETASGERYDPNAWTAAIQTDLRDMFGGVRFGKDYRPVYALVATGDKQAIIKINDVGPLEPGRVIDLNEQTMHYFDPSFERGLIPHVTVTPLLGDGWLPGPLPQGGSATTSAS
jgi:rare lipoprotein A